VQHGLALAIAHAQEAARSLQEVGEVLAAGNRSEGAITFSAPTSSSATLRAKSVSASLLTSTG
jgi:hypothetical protein